MRKFFFLIGFLVTFCFVGGVFAFSNPPQTTPNQKIIGDYFAPLCEAEKQNIVYIITTLSGKTTLGLLLYKKKLEVAGENIDHVHPLRHLGFVFSNQDLTQKTKIIGRVPWNRYVNGFGSPLHLALLQGKLNREVLEDFSKTVNIDVEVIEPMVKKQDWQALVNTLRNSK
ncbi:MAG: hypothetical protein K940chlam3_01478 [Chlamydiae bacterium]|nr:hypothetical protein [Chlamydiota bacterium]